MLQNNFWFGSSEIYNNTLPLQSSMIDMALVSWMISHILITLSSQFSIFSTGQEIKKEQVLSLFLCIDPQN